MRAREHRIISKAIILTNHPVSHVALATFREMGPLVSAVVMTGFGGAAIAAEIRHSPWRLLYKPSKKDINNVEIYDAVREFDQAARHPQRAADVLKASVVNPQTPAQQAQLHQLLRKLNTTFSQFQQVETKFWKAVKQ